jgi:hypothetical protein
MINEEGGVDPEQFRMEAMFDRMDAVGKPMLGSDDSMQSVPQSQVRSDQPVGLLSDVCVPEQLR